MEKRATFSNAWLAFALVSLQLVITLVFFIWPAGQAVYQSFLVEDAFGLSSKFVWFENFKHLFGDTGYRQSFFRTVVFAVSTTVLSLGTSLVFAVMADRVIKGATGYKTLFWYGLTPLRRRWPV